VANKISLKVNGRMETIQTDDPSMPLLYGLRNDLGLHGPGFGCGLAQCGACTVHLNGEAVRSCITPISAAVSKDVVTLEGLGTREKLHPHIRVTRFSIVHDCGQIINPDGTRNQIEGSVVQTMSRTLLEEVKFNRSTITSRDWATYPILTFPEIPDIEIELISRPIEKPWGVGEATAAVVPAAISNAVFDAVGIRLRSVPFKSEKVKAALAQL
jgi:hypothetical protein